jgi:hypothetical protein
VTRAPLGVTWLHPKGLRRSRVVQTAPGG